MHFIGVQRSHIVRLFGSLPSKTGNVRLAISCTTWGAFKTMDGNTTHVTMDEMSQRGGGLIRLGIPESRLVTYEEIEKCHLNGGPQKYIA
jgi:hypothetical protein